MKELNYLLYRDFIVKRREDKIEIGPKEKINTNTYNFVKENKPAILQQLDLLYKHDGVGSELYRRIPKVLAKQDCGCSDTAARLDKAGIQWCKENRENIVKLLREKVKPIFSIGNPLIPFVVKSCIASAEKRNNQRVANYSPDLFVGITTAPRQKSTLSTTVYSVRSLGWEPLVFAEPNSVVADCPTIYNKERLGVWHNFLSMARYSLTTKAEYMLFLQDDIVFHPDTRQLVEDNLSLPFLSLYTTTKYHSPGIQKVRTKALWGTCAILLSRSTVEKLVDHPLTKSWRGVPAKNNKQKVYKQREENPYLIQNSDVAIGKIMNNLGIPMKFVSPSPSKHIAKFSSIKHGSNKGANRNCSPCAHADVSLRVQVNSTLPPMLTSLSPERNQGIATWLKKTKVIALQQEGEEHLEPLFPGVEFYYYPHRPLITDFQKLCNELGNRVILCNSDIELAANIGWQYFPPKTMLIGSRWNYTKTHKDAVWERRGVDVFLLSPGIELPELGFSIGNPMWDYWLPYEYHLQGFTIIAEEEKAFYHKNHKRVWNRTTYLKNLKRFTTHYGMTRNEIAEWILEKKQSWQY